MCIFICFTCLPSLFLLQLEDDIVARPNYFTTMKNFALQQPLEEWMILEFSQLGFIGESLLFVPSSDLHGSGSKPAPCLFLADMLNNQADNAQPY